jgi:serine/threonine-protein kinase
VEGTPFGRYRLVELLGRGGMGEVWRAYDTATDRIVAIKVLPTHLSDDETFQRRFRREAHAAARLNNPHIIPIHFYGEIDGRLYVDMRLSEGRDLQSVLADGPLEPARAVRIIEQVAKALHATHKARLVHRDVKPSNILLEDDDFAYLIDFGIARAVEESRLTKTGDAIGTYHYMAPERLVDDASDDARADIYALTCVLYECLTGRPPFDLANIGSLIAAHLTVPPPQPSIWQPDVPPQFDEVIATGMAKDPDHRYATTVELADAARNAITGPIQRPTANPAQGPPTEQEPTAATATTLGDDRPPQRLPGLDQLPTNLARPQGSATHEGRTPWTVPPTGPPPISGEGSSVPRRNRRVNVALLAGGVALVVVIAVAIGVWAILGHKSPRPSSPAASAQVVALPVSDWVGTWRGTVTGDYNGPYDINLELIVDGQNLRGRVDYPQLGCSGSWTETSKDGNVREFRELIVYQGHCISGAQIRVTHNGDSLSYESNSTLVDIRARLTRVG